MKPDEAIESAAFGASLKTNATEAAKSLMQIVAVVLLALLCSIILHKGYTDISALAQKHSGEKFWLALAQYLIGNLAGGKPPGGS